MPSPPTARPGDPLPREALPEPYGGFRQPELGGAAVGLCATEAEARVLAEHATGGLRIVALTPAAACELRVSGVPHLALEDFYDITALREADEPLLREQAEWSDAVDDAAWAIEPRLETGGFRPAGLAFFNLKVAFDGLYRAAFAIGHLLLARPGEIVAFERPEGAPVPDTLFWTELPERLVVEPLARAAGMPVSVLPAVGDEGDGMDARGGSEEPSAVSQQVRLLREQGPLARARVLAGARRPDLVYSGGYDVSLTAERLRGEHGWRAATLERLAGGPSAPEIDWATTWQRMRLHARLLAPARWCGVDLGPLVESRVSHWWHVLVPRMWAAMHSALGRLEKRPPRALMFYTPTSPEEFGSLQAARASGVPVVTFQHGGFEGNCEYTTHDRVDLRFSDLRLAYGEQTARYYETRNAEADEPRARVAAVGSPRLDSLAAGAPSREEVRERLGLDPSATIVLYTADSYQPDWYAGRHAAPPVDYFRTLARVVDVLERSGAEYAYKPFPGGPDPAARLVRRGRVLEGMGFSDVLWAFDAFVFDIPSTPMFEAMQTDRPILVMADMRSVTLRAEARDPLRRRAELAEDPETFAALLDEFLRRDLAAERNDDREFLRLYGTCRDDGQSAERAAQALIDLAR
jgi:hypothetical protein